MTRAFTKLDRRGQCSERASAGQLAVVESAGCVLHGLG